MFGKYSCNYVWCGCPSSSMRLFCVIFFWFSRFRWYESWNEWIFSSVFVTHFDTISTSLGWIVFGTLGHSRSHQFTDVYFGKYLLRPLLFFPFSQIPFGIYVLSLCALNFPHISPASINVHRESNENSLTVFPVNFVYTAFQVRRFSCRMKTGKQDTQGHHGIT